MSHDPDQLHGAGGKSKRRVLASPLFWSAVPAVAFLLESLASAAIGPTNGMLFAPSLLVCPFVAMALLAFSSRRSVPRTGLGKVLPFVTAVLLGLEFAGLYVWILNLVTHVH